MAAGTPSKNKGIIGVFFLMLVRLAHARASADELSWRAAGLQSGCFFPRVKSDVLEDIRRRCTRPEECSSCAAALTTAPFGDDVLNVSRMPVQLVQVCVLEVLAAMDTLAQPPFLLAWAICFGPSLWTDGKVASLARAANADTNTDAETDADTDRRERARAPALTARRAPSRTARRFESSLASRRSSAALRQATARALCTTVGLKPLRGVAGSGKAGLGPH